MKKFTIALFCLTICSLIIFNPSIQAQGENIKASHLKVRKGIYAYVPNFDFNAKFEILSYQMVYVPESNDTKVVATKGWEFNKEMKKIIKNVKPGDRVYFENIKVKGPAGDRRHIKGIMYKVI